MELRQRTGAGINDISAALQQSGGDAERAIVLLRERGAVKAAKTAAERSTGVGVIESYVHANGRVGVLLELRCESDFVARTDDFRALAHNLAMQVAATGASYLRPEDVPADVVVAERHIAREQLRDSGKPAVMVGKIVEGKLQKWYAESCLLLQPFIKDESLSVQQLIDRAVAKLGEKIEVGKFIRLTA